MPVKYPIYNQQGEKVKELELNPAIFEVPVKEDVVHQVIVAQMANSRQVLAHTKQRAEVKGGGRKPHRQKGTGRARAGSIRSPIWKGGGVTFGPLKTRNFAKKVNKKMKRKALFMTLSDKVTGGRLILLDKFVIDEVKTKKFITIINKLFKVIVFQSSRAESPDLSGDEVEGSPTNVGKTTHSREIATLPTVARNEKSDSAKVDKNGKFVFKTLIVSPNSDKKLILSSRNVPKVKVIRADSLNVKDVIDYKWLIVPVKSLEVIENVYLK